MIKRACAGAATIAKALGVEDAQACLARILDGTASDADLDHAIDEYRLSRVAAAVEAAAHRYAMNGEDIRIDVILLAPGSFPRHIANAWQP